MHKILLKNLVVRFLIKWMFIFFIMSIISFLIVRIMPTSPVLFYLEHKQISPTPENIAILESKWGLDKPLYIQYFEWIKNFISLDWGVSYISNLDIKDEMIRRMPYSIFIGMFGVVFAGIVAFFIGYKAALSKGIYDEVSKFLTLLSQSIPVFILAIWIIDLLGVKLKLTEIFVGDGYIALLIAAIVISFYHFGPLSRVVRKHFIKVRNETYIKAYIVKGFPMEKVILKYGYHESLYGLLSAIIAKFSWVIGGTAVIEFIFAIPGMSTFLVNSISARDYGVIQAYILLMTAWMFFVHAIFNLAMNFLKRGIVYEA